MIYPKCASYLPSSNHIPHPIVNYPVTHHPITSITQSHQPPIHIHHPFTRITRSHPPSIHIHHRYTSPIQSHPPSIHIRHPITPISRSHPPFSDIHHSTTPIRHPITSIINQSITSLMTAGGVRDGEVFARTSQREEPVPVAPVGWRQAGFRQRRWG